jgi:hypothetical protein
MHLEKFLVQICQRLVANCFYFLGAIRLRMQTGGVSTLQKYIFHAKQANTKNF